jgi:hypothetical protein
MSLKLKISHPKIEGPFQASKWLYQRVLLSGVEMKNLFELLGAPFFFFLSKKGRQEDLVCFFDQFLKNYESYLTSLKFEEKRVDKKDFFLAISKDLDPFYLMELNQQECVVKFKRPVILVELFSFHYLPNQDKFIEGAHLENEIRFGLQFSFPQFYQDFFTRKAVEHYKDEECENTLYFKSLQRALREISEPLHLKHPCGKPQRVSYRIGFGCKELIEKHQDIKRQNIEVLNFKEPTSYRLF